jgi:hypothetical protein
MGGHILHAMNYSIDDRDLSAFLVYAARERSLDASLRAANKYGRSDEHRKSIDALRELNKKMLFRETRRDVPRLSPASRESPARPPTQRRVHPDSPLVFCHGWCWRDGGGASARYSGAAGTYAAHVVRAAHSVFACSRASCASLAKNAPPHHCTARSPCGHCFASLGAPDAIRVRRFLCRDP